jgi:hypothetical protein
LTGAAALVTAVVALAGLWRASDNDDSGRSSASGASQTVATREVDESETAATPTAQPETTATAGGGALGEVVRRGEITLTDRDNIDFVDGVVSNGYAGDVVLNGVDPDAGNLTTVRVAMAKAAGQTDRAGCVEALNARRVDHVGHRELPAGTWVCLTTQEGNVVALRVIEPVAIGHPQLVFAYTLWR